MDEELYNKAIAALRSVHLWMLYFDYEHTAQFKRVHDVLVEHDNRVAEVKGGE